MPRTPYPYPCPCRRCRADVTVAAAVAADDADADAADADADADADAGGSAKGRWRRRGDAGAVEPSAYSRGTRARGFAPTPNFASSVFNVCVHNVFNMYSVCVCVCVCVCGGVFFLCSIEH